ncbi:hypothetical protein L198_06664 [Cryptococcus wingfieldii CBS 7118]|uniref:Zn(2)-C6 fungal-type domain-containing protein n=1 Tax=Cryptococcus wingfieldii CBS 7118 TaxID=1295528 RepID=A0A1E3IIH3_9TREE|nr:hypothetical protein L198_06664 [Cryptococcus wingfieldii CBS 7118]ODN88393.1 hypothetical protein L198_06664 [Cryptococcus wingfieldii CBS 7118]
MPKVPSSRSQSFSDHKLNIANPPALSITCAPCRSKKIKCDSIKPTCTNCLKNPERCYYPAKLKPGLRPGTGLEMMKRVEMLEEKMELYGSQLAEHESRLSSMPYSVAGPSFSYDNNTPLSDPNQQAQQHQQDRLEQAYTTGISPGMSSRGQMPPPLHAISANLPPSSQPFAYPPNPSPSSAGGPVYDRQSFALSSASPHVNNSVASPGSFLDPQILPPDDIVRDLITLFFTHIHPWCPILSASPSDFQPPWGIVHHAIVVVSLRFSRDPRITTSKSAIKQQAKQHVLAHAVESTSVASLQALALLAVDLIGSDQGPSSWGILALLTRSAVHLGLSREDDPPPPPPSSSTASTSSTAHALSRTSILPPPGSWQEDESRRRLFWWVFVLDRYVCCSTGWEFAVPDGDVGRRMPCPEAVWTQPEWHQTPTFASPLSSLSISSSSHHHPLTPLPLTSVSPLAYLVEALDLLGRAHTLQGEKINLGDRGEVEGRRGMALGVTRVVRAWWEVRDVAGIGDVGMRLMIQAIHHATLLKLNASHAYPALLPPTRSAQEPFLSTCLNSARAMARLVEEGREAGWERGGALFVWGCWVAARVLFVHAFLNNQKTLDDDFEVIVGALKEQAEYWGLATQYVKLLERAKRKMLNSRQSHPPTFSSTTNSYPHTSHSKHAPKGPEGPEGHSSALPDAIHVLLDLRRTAYGAVGTNIQETPHTTPPPEGLEGPEGGLGFVPGYEAGHGHGHGHGMHDVAMGAGSGSGSDAGTGRGMGQAQAQGGQGQGMQGVEGMDLGLDMVPAWAVQPGLEDLYSWFDLPAGLFHGEGM